ncbi:hypothetical protein WDU94_011844 [Cyamophila willieti]
MGKVTPRDVTPVIQILRQVMLGRRYKVIEDNPLRFQEHNIVARTQPLPNLPEGPHHILSANYYCNRDGSHEVQPPAPLYLANAAQKQIGESKTSEHKLRTPGLLHDWDMHKY